MEKSYFKHSIRHRREALTIFFYLKKHLTEAHGVLQNICRGAAPSESTHQDWFISFKEANFDVDHRLREGRSKPSEDPEFGTLLNKDSCRTKNEPAPSLGVTGTVF